MFELTNEQRECFALAPVCDKWERIEIKASRCDCFKTYIYLDGNEIVKCILSSQSDYSEYELSEKVSPDRKYLLPKTAKGKPTPLTSSNLLKRKGVGMRLNYKGKNVHLYNEITECSYYFNTYLADEISDLDGFSRWVENWCNETTDDDRTDILRFSQQNRKHIRYQEGDVFRFKIGRRLYGYGRILLDYDKMRKNKEPFWDIFMLKPLVCSVYHIVTDRDDVTVEELKHLSSLPSIVVSDFSIFYGENEIIGNLPVTDNEDYPIMYGNSISFKEKAVCYQCGKTFRKIENCTELFSGYRNNGVAMNVFNFKLNILLQCIKENSNAPYWTLYFADTVDCDLRNPKNADKLKQIKEQFGLK